MTDQPSVSKVPCTWCLNGQRKTWVPAGHVVLFACVREHMIARPLCQDCADSDDAHIGALFYCTECIDAGEPRSDDGPLCCIDLVTTREDWMSRIESGLVRLGVSR
jgi:hypothetical protein